MPEIPSCCLFLSIDAPRCSQHSNRKGPALSTSLTSFCKARARPRFSTSEGASHGDLRQKRKGNATWRRYYAEKEVSMVDKRLSLKEAIAEYVQDDLSVAIEGFTAFICFAAGHEIIRQRRRNLTLIRMTPDVIYDQMVAAGVAGALVFSYLGNPGVGPLHCLRRAIEKGIPRPLEIEEYSHYGMVGRYLAGASHLPFFPLRSYLG